MNGFEEKDIQEVPLPSKILDVSWATILRITLALSVLYLLYLIRDILIWFVFALIISILFDPAIDFLRKWHIPRTMAAILVYLSIFVVLGFTIYAIAPFLFAEFQQFSLKFPYYFEKASPYFSGLKIEALKNFENFSKTLEEVLTRASSNIFSAIGTIFGGIFSAVAIFSIAFFLSLEEKGIERSLALITPLRYRDSVLNIWEKSKKKITRWFATRIIGMIFVGLFTFITCYVLNVKYAVFFGLLAGVSDLIVTIGPLLAGGVIALFIALSSLSKAVIFIIAFLIIQEIEGHILLPILSKKFLRLSPALVLIALLIGAKLWGILGAILAIPLTGMLFEFIKEFFARRKERLSST
jgi:predicted PurR-regulated permease PerM